MSPKSDFPCSSYSPLGHIPMPEVKVKCVDDSGACSCSSNRASMPLLRRSLTNDELQRRLQVALNEGTSNIAQTLVGLNVRTGYTHADSFRDLAPSVVPANGAQPNSISMHGLDAHIGPALYREKALQLEHRSSSDVSDSDGDINATMIPMTARATPYHSDPSSSATHHAVQIPAHHTHSKRPFGIRGPSLRTVNRHMTNSAAPSVHYNGPGSLIRGDLRDPGRGEEKRRHAGPLIRGLKVHGQGE